MENISIFEFRRMVKGFDKIYGSMMAEDAPASFDESTKQLFYKYLDRVSPVTDICKDHLSTIYVTG